MARAGPAQVAVGGEPIALLALAGPGRVMTRPPCCAARQGAAGLRPGGGFGPGRPSWIRRRRAPSRRARHRCHRGRRSRGRNGYEPDGPAGSAVWPAAATTADRGRCRAGTGAGGGAVALAAAAPSQAEPGRRPASPLPCCRRCRWRSRWRPLWVLAVVVAASLAEITEGSGLFGLAAVALYSVAAYCRGGRRPGRASPPGPSWPGRCARRRRPGRPPGSWSRSA